MLQINLVGNHMNINGENISFPASIAEIEKVLGKSEMLTEEGENVHISYIFHEYGMVFEAYSREILKLKKCKVFKDDEHIICYANLYFGEKVRQMWDETALPKKPFVGKLTVDGKAPCFYSDRAETELFHLIKWTDKAKLPEGAFHDKPGQYDTFTEPISISFVPIDKRGRVNYKLKPCKEEVLTFEDFSFKLAIIQELMYHKELLQPYFDIYGFAEQYRGKAIKVDSERPIKQAVKFFEKIQIPKRLAGEVESICMDGGNEIYANIAPLWEGEDDMFDLTCVTEEELGQFPNLKSAVIMSRSYDRVAAVFEKAGILVKEL